MAVVSVNLAVTGNQQVPWGRKPHSCSSCGKAFWYSANLVKHQRLHSEEKPYKCRECGHAFRKSCEFITTAAARGDASAGAKSVAVNQRPSLMKHQRTRTGEKPSRCRVCAKHYSSLIYRQRTHTGEKPCKCGDCREASSDGSILSRHHWTHTGEKPFECKEW